MSPSSHHDLDPTFVEAIEALPDGFAIHDAQRRPILVNKVAYQRFSTFYDALFRGASYRDALLESIEKISPRGSPEERDQLADWLLKLYDEGGFYETRTEDGLIVRANYQSMSGGRRVAISSDITDLRQREKELKRLEKQAVAASEAKSAFLANMSHEIRTPLNGVMGMAQVLAMSELAPDQRDQVSTILDSSKTLMSILNDVLDLSKIEAGRVSVVPQDADILHTMRGLHRLWSPKAEEAGLKFSLSFDAELPQMLNFDAVRVRQCASNLISNAIKFTEKGRVDVSVSASAKTDGRTLVAVSVRDTGVGMDEETQGRLFQAFEQADDTTSRKYGGTGLGLSIVRRLAELMGGEAFVESEPGRGSEFTFSFLANPPETIAQIEKRAAQIDASSAPAEIHGLKVLLVDDHPVNRKVASLVLRPFDMEIVEATHGKEALAALAVERFDLILLDMHMPVMDGPQTIAAIRASEESWKTVPIVALTADAMSGDRQRYLAMGADGYLSKPLAVDDLIAEIARVRRLNRGERSAAA